MFLDRATYAGGGDRPLDAPHRQMTVEGDAAVVGELEAARLERDLGVVGGVEEVVAVDDMGAELVRARDGDRVDARAAGQVLPRPASSRASTSSNPVRNDPTPMWRSCAWKDEWSGSAVKDPMKGWTAAVVIGWLARRDGVVGQELVGAVGQRRKRVALRCSSSGVAWPDHIATTSVRPLRTRGVQDRAEQVALVGVGLDRSGGGEPFDELVGDALREAAAEGLVSVVRCAPRPSSSALCSAVSLPTRRWRGTPCRSALLGTERERRDDPLDVGDAAGCDDRRLRSSTAIRTSGSVPTSESSACARKAPR